MASALSAQTSPPYLTRITGGGYVEDGQNVFLTVLFNGPGTGQTYEWKKSGVVIPGANSSTYTIVSATAGDTGTYTVTVTNAAGAGATSTAVIVGPPRAPTFTTSPAPKVVQVNQPATFSFAADGSYPRTVQWQKDGADIAGATGLTYSIAAATLADVGTYAVKVTNAYGSATSPAASLTVNAATLPTLSTNSPGDATLVEGASATFDSSAQSGSYPYTYQWLKNGVAISGATSSQLYIPAITLADAGRYSVVWTNAAGSVTSREAVLTVTPATPLSVTRSPAAVTLFEGESAAFEGVVSGSLPITYQWLKDGVPVPGNATSYLSLPNAKVSDSGDYVLRATNVLGSVTTAAAKLTVKPPLLAAISAQPRDATQPEGSTLALTVTASGSPTLKYQWYFNGAAISGATSAYYSFYQLKPTDAGEYYVVITNSAGAVKSRTATLVVSPTPAPDVLRFANQTIELGASFQLRSDTFYQSAPPSQTYQWYKDGQPVANATGAVYSVSAAKAEDAGDYFVVITNSGGTTTSRTTRVILKHPFNVPAGAWLAAERGGNVVYFTFASPPRVERFDLATETWLPTIALSRAPTALTADAAAFYLGMGSAVVRYNAYGANPTVVSNAFDSDVTGLALWNGYVLAGQIGYANSRLSLVRLSDGVKGPTTSMVYYWNSQMAVAPTLGKVFSFTNGISPGDIVASQLQADGTAGAAVDSPYHGVFPVGRRVFVSPDESYVVQDAGIAYRTSDLKFAGGFGGAFDDLTFTAAGTPAVLRANTVELFNGQFTPTAKLATGIDAVRVFVHGGNVFAFGYPTSGGSIAQAKVALAAAVAPAAAAPLDAAGLRYTPDATFLDKNGVLHLFSKVNRQIFRWSSAEGRYLDPLPLRGWPDFATYSAVLHRIYLGYNDGQIRQIKLDTGSVAEESFAAVPLQVCGLMVAGDYVLAADPGGAWSAQYLFASDGRQTATREWVYVSADYAWNAAQRRVYYFRGEQSTDQLLYTGINLDGTFGTQKDFSLVSSTEKRTPLRLSPDGATVLLGTGTLYDANTVQVTASLANRIDDAVWLNNFLYTGRQVPKGVELQRWSGSQYLLDRVQLLPGRLMQLLALAGNRLLAVTVPAGGSPAFTMLDADLFDPASTTQPIVINQQPQSTMVVPDGTATLTLDQSGATGLLNYRWTRNGVTVDYANGASLLVQNAQPLDSGLYEATVTGLNGMATSNPAILGLSSTQKIIGSGAEVGTNIVHPNGNIYDQVLLQGAAATVTADPGQVLRMSYVDLTDDIVQVEFSGAGTLSLVLASATGPATAANYNQPAVNYMKGHAGIVITGANETTNLSVFSVGKANAVNQALFKDGVTYDGVADIAFVAIQSANGKFGGLRTANASYFSSRGVTGVYAPGVEFTGPVYVSDISAFDAAHATLILGKAAEVKITGGDLLQGNGQPLRVGGLTQVRFVDGATSGGAIITAKTNRARLEENGTDVTSRLIVNP